MGILGVGQGDLLGRPNGVVFKAQAIFASWSCSHFANIFQSCPRVCIRLGNAKWEKHPIIEREQASVDLRRGPQQCVGLGYVGRTLVQAARPTEAGGRGETPFATKRN